MAEAIRRNVNIRLVCVDMTYLRFLEDRSSDAQVPVDCDPKKCHTRWHRFSQHAEKQNESLDWLALKWAMPPRA